MQAMCYCVQYQKYTKWNQGAIVCNINNIQYGGKVLLCALPTIHKLETRGYCVQYQQYTRLRQGVIVCNNKNKQD